MSAEGHAAPWTHTAQEIAKALGGEKRSGRSWKACCPCHADKSPSLTLTDDHGTVLVHCHAGCEQRAVLQALRARGFGPDSTERPRKPHRNGEDAKSPDWTPLIPPPATAGPVPEHMLADFDTVHRYTSLDDRETHYVGRIEARGNKRKVFVPITYGVLDGKRGWHKKAPNAPRPLYGLNRLTSMPDAVVILTEGELKCDAAQRMFPDHACLSISGGVGQAEHNDVTPLAARQVIYWPDADKPGLDAARKLVPRLPVGTRLVRVDDLADGFDAADLEKENPDDPDAWLVERLVSGTPIMDDQNGAVPAIITIGHFLQLSKPPQFLVDRVIQRGSLHTLTARTFHGKTTTMSYLMLSVGCDGLLFAGLHTERGRVVLLAGENPDDTAAKLQVACDYWQLNPADLNIDVMPGAFDLAGNIDAVLADIAKGGPVALVDVDTSSAYRVDPDEDDNQASKVWAQNLRRLVELPGRPAVIVPTHPVKNAPRDCLLPRGGSGYLNEVDSNLALWCDDLLAARPSIELHWQGKHRGPNFNPIRLEMVDQPHPTFTFHDGKPVPLKVAIPAAKPASAFDGLDDATMARIFNRLREEPKPGVHWSPDKRAKFPAISVIVEEAHKTPEQAEEILAVWKKRKLLGERDYWNSNGNKARRIFLNEGLFVTKPEEQRKTDWSKPFSADDIEAMKQRLARGAADGKGS